MPKKCLRICKGVCSMKLEGSSRLENLKNPGEKSSYATPLARQLRYCYWTENFFDMAQNGLVDLLIFIRLSFDFNNFTF